MKKMYRIVLSLMMTQVFIAEPWRADKHQRVALKALHSGIVSHRVQENNKAYLTFSFPGHGQNIVTTMLRADQFQCTNRRGRIITFKRERNGKPGSVMDHELHIAIPGVSLGQAIFVPKDSSFNSCRIDSPFNITEIVPSLVDNSSLDSVYCVKLDKQPDKVSVFYEPGV